VVFVEMSHILTQTLPQPNQ